MYLVQIKTEIGTVRETFFANQLASASHSVEYEGDFLILASKHLFRCTIIRPLQGRESRSYVFGVVI